jgi:predicted PurR-regulated permease PerM
MTEPGDQVPTPPSAPAPAAPSQTRVALQILLIVAAVASGIWALLRLERVVLVLILATFFAYVIAPLVQIAQRPVRIAGRPRHLSRGLAIAAVYVVLLGAAYAGAAILLPSATQQFDDAVARAPTYTRSFRAWQHGWSRYYERLGIPIELRQGINRSLQGAGDAALDYARGTLVALVGILSNVPWLVLVPVLAFLLLKDAAHFKRIILTTFPHRIRLRGHRLFEDLNATLAAYIRAQLLACLLVGSLCGIGFAALGVPYPILLGVLAGIMEFIPLVGPLVVAAAAVVIAALHAPVLALWTALFLMVLRILEDYVIYPRLIGRNIHLHPLVVIIAVLAGAELDGVTGMFMAVPTVAVVSVAARHWLGWHGQEPGNQG